MFRYIVSGLTGFLLIQQTVTRIIAWPLIVVVKTKTVLEETGDLDNPVEQVCHFNKLNDDEYYNIFTSKRIKEEGYDNGIYFKTEKVRGRTDRENFDAKKKLEDGASNVRFSRIFSDAKPEPEHTGAGTKRHGDSIEHIYRKGRKSSRPKFLLGQ